MLRANQPERKSEWKESTITCEEVIHVEWRDKTG